MSHYNFIQTFYADSEAVNNSSELLMTSIDLYFAVKPYSDDNDSGTIKPQVTMWICEVENGVPNPERRLNNSVTYVEWDRISVSSTSAASTTFAFRNPVVLKTNRYYGIVIKFQDSGFFLWQNIKGNRIINESGVTQTISSGSSSTTDGILYASVSDNSDAIRYTDRDLKYQIKVAKFNSSNTSIYVVNKDYEFLTIQNISGGFIPGEVVYKQTSNATGTITVSSTNNFVTGTSTTFEDLYEGQTVIIDTGSANGAFVVKSIANNTQMNLDRSPNFSGTARYKAPVCGKVYQFSIPNKTLYLDDSNAANSTFKLVAADTLVGARSGATAKITSVDRFRIDAFVPKFVVNGPLGGTFNFSYSLASEANSVSSSYSSLSLNNINRTNQASYVLSRSQEVDVGTTLYGGANLKKSLAIKLDLSVNSDKSYTAPFIDCDDVDLIVKKNYISNAYAATVTYTSTANTSYSYSIPDYDTEVDRNGIAISKYISKKISFAPGAYAEDLKTFVVAYRPPGTNIRIYAKIHNSADIDSFDAKSWTPLVLEQNNDKYSRENDETDLIEYVYSFPQYSEILQNLGETSLAEYGSNILETPSSLFSDLQQNDIIRVYKPDFAEDNHEVFAVLSSSSSTITLNKAIKNTDIVGGLGQPKVSVGIDKLKYKEIAFNNIANDNVVRYYTSSKTQFDSFNTMQIKIVLLSDSSYKIPKVEQLQTIAVSV